MHFQLNSEPRRHKRAARKSVSISTLPELKNIIINETLDKELEAIDIDPIPADALMDLGLSFCGVPPLELSLATIQPEENDQ
jgi:hypothetical protein